MNSTRLVCRRPRCRPPPLCSRGEVGLLGGLARRRTAGAGGRLGRDSGNLSCCFAICSPLASAGFTLLALLYFTGPGNPRPMRPRFTERRDAPRLRPKMGNAQPEREWHMLGELHRAEKAYVGARVAGAKFDSGHIKGHLTLGSEVPDAPEPERPPRTRGFWRLVSAHRSAKAALDQTTCVAGTEPQ